MCDLAPAQTGGPPRRGVRVRAAVSVDPEGAGSLLCEGAGILAPGSGASRLVLHVHGAVGEPGIRPKTLDGMCDQVTV